MKKLLNQIKYDRTFGVFIRNLKYARKLGLSNRKVYIHNDSYIYTENGDYITLIYDEKRKMELYGGLDKKLIAQILNELRNPKGKDIYINTTLYYKDGKIIKPNKIQ